MAYLVNQSSPSRLTINGVDYSSNLVSWSANDASTFNKGFMTTDGQLVLGDSRTRDISDYDRNDFLRGAVVLLDIQVEGQYVRHPRGYLYVVSSSYNADSRQLTVEIACEFSLAFLTDTLGSYLALSPMELEPARQTLQNVDAALATFGRFAYQNNRGEIATLDMFGLDGDGSFTSGAWNSILGTTVIQVSPLNSNGAIPETIRLSYTVPSGLEEGDQTGKIEVSETTSYYFLDYPSVIYVRENLNIDGDNAASGSAPSAPASTGSLPEGPSEVENDAAFTASSNGEGTCGSGPSDPNEDGGGASCSSGYTTKRTPMYVPAITRQVDTSEYSGPGASLSRTVSERYGPKVEANNGYYGDKFAFCRLVWAISCSPNGDCPLDGLEEALLNKTESYYYYGEGNQLVQQVTDTYQTLMSAAKTEDYRAGNNQGQPQGFTELDETMPLYRVSRVIQDYYVKDGVNVNETTTFTSVTSRGVGISSGADLDALAGIKTSSIRRSFTITTQPIAPDALNSPVAQTETKQTEIALTGGYVIPPIGAGPYVIEQSMPLPILLDDAEQIEEIVAFYSTYIQLFTLGDLYGVSIAEGLRPEVFRGWTPNMPFRYSDPYTGKAMVCRMNATNWAVSQEQVGFRTNGLWLGFSGASSSSLNNLVGDTRPIMEGGVDSSGLPTTRPNGSSLQDGDKLIGSNCDTYEYISGAWTPTTKFIAKQPTEPVARDDGSALQTGDTWVTAENVYVYSGTSFDVSTTVVIDLLGAPLSRIDGSTLVVGDLWINGCLGKHQYNGLGWNEVFSEIITQADEPTTRPSGDALQLGDFWVDSDDGFTVYVYNGASFDATSNVLIDQFTAPSSQPGGQPWEADDIWVDCEGQVYQYNGAGWIVSTIDVTTSDEEPTLNSQGGVLVGGDIWQNTASGEIFEYDGAAWQPSSIVVDVCGVFAPITPGSEIVTGQPMNFIISNMIGVKQDITSYGNDGVYTPVPGGENLTQEPAITPACYVTGFIIEPGGLLATEGNGAVPVDILGGLIVETATLVNPDIFSA